MATQVREQDIADDAITAAKIAANAVTESEISLSDVTSDNVSITAHGFAPKAPNDATKYLDGTGAYTVPPGGAPSGSAGGVLSGTYPNPGFAADMATQAELDAHISDTSAAHAASAISADSTTLVGTGTDVQAVLEELDNGIADHLADTTAAHAASAVSVNSATLVGTGTDAQAVFEELDDAIASLVAAAGIPGSTFDAKGDILVGSANDAYDNLAVGSNDQVLTAASGETLGVKWAAPGTPADGWNSTAVSFTYSSAAAPTYVCTTGSSLVGVIPVGAKIKLTHSSTTKYFIVTAIDASTITLYGGTDYTLAATAITSVYYSLMQAPVGFPGDLLKWTVEVTDTTLRTQTNPVNGTWYNLGSVSITVPIGCWRVYYEVAPELINTASDTVILGTVTLSTANNTESDKAFSGLFVTGDASAAGKDIATTIHREKVLTLAASSQRFLNSKSDSGGTSLHNQNGLCTCVIRAECVYL